jgi:hypothetical protein
MTASLIHEPLATHLIHRKTLCALQSPPRGVPHFLLLPSLKQDYTNISCKLCFLFDLHTHLFIANCWQQGRFQTQRPDFLNIHTRVALTSLHGVSRRLKEHACQVWCKSVYPFLCYKLTYKHTHNFSRTKSTIFSFRTYHLTTYIICVIFVRHDVKDSDWRVEMVLTIDL